MEWNIYKLSSIISLTFGKINLPYDGIAYSKIMNILNTKILRWDNLIIKYY